MRAAPARPEIITPPLLEPGAAAPYRHGAAIPGCWPGVAVLTAIEPMHISPLLGTGATVPPIATGPAGGAPLPAAPRAGRRQPVARTGQPPGARISRSRSAGTSWPNSKGRWHAPARREWQLNDPLAVKLAGTTGAPVLEEVRRVIPAALPDPPELLLTLLTRWSGGLYRGGRLVAAPPEEKPRSSMPGGAAPAGEVGRPADRRGQRVPGRPRPPRGTGRAHRSGGGRALQAAPPPAADGETPQIAIGVP